MNNKLDTLNPSTIGVDGIFNEKLVIVIILINLIFTIFCLIKCFQIFSWVKLQKIENLSNSKIPVNSSLAPQEADTVNNASSERPISNKLLIDNAIKLIRAGFTQSQVSQKLDIEKEYLNILHRAYYRDTK